jgi:hypothetical protein
MDAWSVLVVSLAGGGVLFCFVYFSIWGVRVRVMDTVLLLILTLNEPVRAIF